MRLSGVILDFFIFFYDKILQAQKAQKDAYKQTKLKKTSKEKVTYSLIYALCFLCSQKTSKKKKFACLMFLCFFAHKKRLKRKLQGSI